MKASSSSCSPVALVCSKMESAFPPRSSEGYHLHPSVAVQNAMKYPGLVCCIRITCYLINNMQCRVYLCGCLQVSINLTLLHKEYYEVKPNGFHIFLKMSPNIKTVLVENLVESRHTVMILPCMCRLPTWRGRHSTDSTSSTVRSPTANLTLACNHCCILPLRPSLGSQAGSGLAPISPTIKTTLYRRWKVLQLSGRATLSPSQSCSHIQMMTATLPTTIHTPTPCCKYVPHAISFPTPILDKWAQSN